MTINLYIACVAGALCFTCVFLVLHREYEDGLIGRLGLSLIGLAGGGRSLDAINHALVGDIIVLSPTGFLLWTGMLLFLARHCHRFMQRKSKTQQRTTGVERSKKVRAEK